MIKNFYGQEVYREETMEYSEFEEKVYIDLGSDLYPYLNDEMLDNMVWDILEEKMSMEQYLELEKRLWDRHRQRRNAERRKQRELLKKAN